jgi:hypothetical protein
MNKTIRLKKTKLFLPTPDKGIWKDIKSNSTLSPARLSRIMRFLTGHTFMNRHKTLIERGYNGLDYPDALCRLCKEELEDPDHLITSCPVLNRERLEIIQMWQMNAPPEWSLSTIRFIKLPIIISLEKP